MIIKDIDELWTDFDDDPIWFDQERDRQFTPRLAMRAACMAKYIQDFEEKLRGHALAQKIHDAPGDEVSLSAEELLFIRQHGEAYPNPICALLHDFLADVDKDGAPEQPEGAMKVT